MVLPKLVGKRIKRREDPRLVAGTSTYVDDLKLHGTLYCGIVRSVYAHAKIKSIDTEAARQHPGVFAVVTGEDLKASGVGTLPVAHRFGEGLKVPPRYPLAVDEVNFVGEAVAAVVATDRYVARDAIDLVNVEYEPLPVGGRPRCRVRGRATRPRRVRHNVAFEWALDSETGTPIDDAEVKVSQRIEKQRLAPVPMEGRGVVADYDKGKKSLTLWTSTQIPHLLRTFLSLLVGLPENHVRVVAPEVGGGFGMKLNVYAEEGIAAALSMKLGKPVKWIESRAENMAGSIHGRGQVQYVDVGATKDGKITALHVHILADLGAYHQLLTPVIPTLTGLMLTGSYTIPNLQCTVHGIFTNKVPTDAYRGAGRPEATYLIERVCDLVAHATGVDPVEVRRRNFIGADKFPYTTAVGLSYDSGNYPGRAREGAGAHQVRCVPRGAGRGAQERQVPRHRLQHVRGSLRHGAIRRDARRIRLGELHRPRRSDRQSDGDDGRIAARSGAGDDLRPDHRRRTRRRGGRCDHQPRRHGGLAVRRRHLRLARHGGRRRGDDAGDREGAGEGEADRRAHARSIGG